MPMDVQDGSSSLIFVFLVPVAFVILSLSERAEPNLKHISAAGWAGYLLSYFDAFRFICAGPAVLRRGYEKYQPGVFKVATLNRWLVIVTATQHVEEIRKATEDEVSFVDAANEPDGSPYLIGHCHNIVVCEDTNTLTRHITQNLAFMLADLRDEVVLAFSKAMPPMQVATCWAEADALNLVLSVTTRASNRLFVGPDICRDVDYKRLSNSIASEPFQPRFHIIPHFFPNFVKLIFRICSRSYRNRRQLQNLFTKLIQERKNHDETLVNDHESKSSDLLSWILRGSKQTFTISALFDLSITANQTLSMNFLHVLYHLAANPKYASPMRKEIESLVSREGWTKSSLEKMRKLDSFIRESMRISGISSLSMMRKTLRPFAFSDGTIIPTGALISAAADARHVDASLCGPSPMIFDGFRYSKLYDQHHGDDPTMGGGTRFQLVAATTGYLAWGYGRHACPGRFFAAAVLKMLLAHIVMNYDVRFEDGKRPHDVIDGANRLPNPTARILFRKT